MVEMSALLKSWARSIGATRAFSHVVRTLESLDAGRTNVCHVLTYHRVDTPESRPHLSPDTLSATPDEFRRQMEHLAASYRVVSLDGLLAALASERPLPPRSVLLTFDDGYRDFIENAWPVLRKLRLPATMFVPTAFPDNRGELFWWDRIHDVARRDGNTAAATTLAGTIKSMPHARAFDFVEHYCQRHPHTPEDNETLTWSELRQLSADGLTLAPHTRTHPLLNRVPVEVAVEEAVGSHRDIEKQVGAAPKVLAYPAGAFSPAVADGLRVAGFDAAFTTCRGANDLRAADPMLLRRINVAIATPTPLTYSQLLASARHLNRCLPVRSAS